MTFVLAALLDFELDELDFELAELLQPTKIALSNTSIPVILAHFFKISPPP